MFQAIDLFMDRCDLGWEVRSSGDRGIIFGTYEEAVAAAAEVAQARPGDLTIRRDGTVVVHREDPNGHGRPLRTG